MRKRSLAALAAIVLCVSALAAAPAAAVTPTGAAYVALGDSVASGNGILPYLDKECLRSKRSYPELLAKELGVAVVSAACTEAATADVHQQIVALSESGALGPATELVTLTVGVNNVEWLADGDPDWADALIACSDAQLFPPGSCPPAISASSASLASVPEEIESLIEAVRTRAPAARIIVTGYPLLFGQVVATCHVGLLHIPTQGVRTPLAFGADETKLINRAVLDANDLIARGVAEYAAQPGADATAVAYVDVNDAPAGVETFTGHALCDRGDRWISGLLPQTAQTADRGFHPNAAGHAAYADIIAAAIEG